ncbi:MAG: tyrosinase family protein [Acidimicrobiales bacterium]
MAKPRRNIAHLSPQERQAFVDAVLGIDLLAYADGVSYWDKQDQIHQSTHNHNGNSFLPWHRELVNRFEALLQQVDPDIALPYWDWTEDPRAAGDGQGGTVDLSDDALMGTMSGAMSGVLAGFHNGGLLAGSREATGDPADPPRIVERDAGPGAPAVDSDATIIAAGAALAQAQQWTAFQLALESAHDTAHGYVGGDIGALHAAFEDPFVFLLHANVDRLFAMWQTTPGQNWRLDPGQVYGDQANTADPKGILHNLQPWDGTVQFGAPIEPWTGASPSIVVRNSAHPAVVRPPCYDTLPLTVEQVAPLAGDPIRFLGVVEFLPVARALRLRVRGCRAVTANASVTAPFTLQQASVTTADPEGFEVTDLLVWVLYAPGGDGTADSGTLTVEVPETGDVFVIDVEATVVANPTVASSLVLDTSASMSAASGVGVQTRMGVLHSAAPLFVQLLDDTDGVGVVRFDTDAVEVEPVQVAGPLIGGGGRADAFAAIANSQPNPLGLTAIGDGLQAGDTQLAMVAGGFDSSATVVFTDGHETADQTIAAVSSLINSRVFAIGLGTADQLNPGALSDIADGTGGYLLLTGNPGPDDTILLQKYFAQVLAGATNSAIVVDPDGIVPVGGSAVVAFPLTAADIRADVIVLSEMAGVLDISLVAPDGTTLPAGASTTAGTGSYRMVRFSPSSLSDPSAAAGQWKAVLRVDRKRLKKWFSQYRERLAGAEHRRSDQFLERRTAEVKVHGVPFTLSVQARSALRLDVSIAQASRRPGSPARLIATLTDSGIPLGGSAAVTAVVTAPGGATSVVRLGEDEPGRFIADLATYEAGVYRVLVRASGDDLRGTAFLREELRTAAVWARGDDPSPAVVDPSPDRGDGLDPCRLLACLLGIDGVRGALERHGIDPDEVAACVKRTCR